jgi:iron complex transport system substrate-binding protein
MKPNKGEWKLKEKMKPTAKIFMASAFLLLSVLATPGYAAAGREAPRAAAETRIFIDSTGRELELPAKITRIAPSGGLAEMFLIAIAPELLCAVSSEPSPGEAEFFPKVLAGLPVVGQFYGGGRLNPEEIAKIGPDVIIDIGEPKASIASDMNSITRATAVPAIHITAALRSTPEAYRTLGKLLDREEKGEALARFCERTLALADGVVSGAGVNKKTALYCLGRQGLNVLAKGSFHTEIFDWMTDNRAVVDNPSSRGGGNETDLEQILLWDPEIIFFGPGSIYAAAGADPVWKQLRAVRSGAYYEVPSGPYNWMGSPPSINRYLGMLWMGKVLYPQYAGYDLYTEAAEYYRLFYGYELSREQFNRLIHEQR